VGEEENGEKETEAWSGVTQDCSGWQIFKQIASHSLTEGN